MSHAGTRGVVEGRRRAARVPVLGLLGGIPGTETENAV